MLPKKSRRLICRAQPWIGLTRELLLVKTSLTMYLWTRTHFLRSGLECYNFTCQGDYAAVSAQIVHNVFARWTEQIKNERYVTAYARARYEWLNSPKAVDSNTFITRFEQRRRWDSSISAGGIIIIWISSENTKKGSFVRGKINQWSFQVSLSLSLSRNRVIANVIPIRTRGGRTGTICAHVPLRSIDSTEREKRTFHSSDARPSVTRAWGIERPRR